MTSYLIYSLSLVFLILLTGLYFTRATWASYLPESTSNLIPNIPTSFRALLPSRYRYDPLDTDNTGDFASDAAAGLHSSNFDLSGNIENGDGRGGLDERAKGEIKRVMERRKINFDEARRMVVMERFKKHGVGADGRPRDPKFVSFG
ncbi:MAG: hypothetical protein M1831_002900 [Alyxoria varia]|nr:MAG: hypothetical protein M1831_002900 [Alyxoria varia]